MGNYEIVKLLTQSPRFDIISFMPWRLKYSCLFPMYRVDINIVESNSCSALMIACMHGFCDVATEILLRDDCDVSIGSFARDKV